MNKTLLLLFLWTVSMTLSFGQSGTNLNRATRFAVLATTEVINNGASTVTGDLGISPGSNIAGETTLTVTGTKDLGNAAAAGAMADAKSAYDALWENSSTPLASPIGNTTTIRSGVYRISGDASLRGFLTLDARGDVNAKFVFLIDGNFSSETNAVILLLNGAQSQNVYWVVEGNSAVLGASNLFHGNILAQGDITLSNAVSLTGRVISLGGSVTLNNANILQPIQFENNLVITKTVTAGPYIFGQQVTYTITARNNGPSSAINVVVDEQLPTGLTFVSANSSRGTYDPAANNWVIGTLRNRETETLRLTFTIDQPGALVNTVSISGGYSDPDNSDNTAEVEIEAICLPAPTAISSSVTGTTTCQGQEITLTAAAVTGADSYTWTVPTGWTVVSEDRTTATLVVIPAATGTVSVGANKTGCGIGPLATREIIVTPQPTAPTSITSSSATPCLNTSITYSVAAVDGITNTWTVTGDYTVGGDGDLTGNSITITLNGPVTIAVTGSNGTCSSTATTLTVNPTTVPTAPAIAGNATTCVSTTAVAYSVTGVAGETYAWTTTGNIAISGAATGTSVNVIVSGAGTLTVTATNACGSTASNLSITPTTAPTAPAIAGNATTCVSTTAVAYSVTGVAGETYAWTTTGNIAISGAATGTSVNVIVSGAGTLTVTATNACGSTASNLSITPTTAPTAPAIAGNATTCVSTTAVAYSVTGVAGETYAWTTTGNIAISGAATGTSVNVIVSGAGTLTVTATNACGSTASNLSITPTTAPTAPAIAGNATTCVSTTAVAYSVTGVAGETYAWTTTGNIAISGAATGTSVNVIVSGAGTLTVTATNACGSTASNLSITPITVFAAPTAISSSATGVTCQGQEITLTAAAATGAGSYTWTVPAGWTVVSENRTTATLVVIPAATGTVSVAANYECGVSAETSTTITVTPLPAAPASIMSSNAAPCLNTSVTYSVAAVNGVTNTWTVTGDYTIGGDGNLTGNEITITLNGPVTIAVTGSNNTCSSAATTLTVNPVTAPATPGAITGPAEVCANSMDVVFSVAEVAGATTYNWTVPAGWTITAGAGTNSITVTTNNAGGNVMVEVSNTCFPTPIQSAPKAVGISTPPAAVAAIMDNSTLCDGLAFSVAAVTGATTYNWTVPAGFTITSGQGTTAIKVTRNNNTATGNVTITASNATGCPGAATSLIIDTDVLNGELNFPKAFSPNNDGINDTWAIKNLLEYPENEVVIFSRYGSEVFKMKNYQNNWTGNGLEKGTYFYKVTVKLCDGQTKQYTGYTTIFR